MHTLAEFRDIYRDWLTRAALPLWPGTRWTRRADFRIAGRGSRPVMVPRRSRVRRARALSSPMLLGWAEAARGRRSRPWDLPGLTDIAAATMGFMPPSALRTAPCWTRAR